MEHLFNLFEIFNTSELRTEYQLVGIDGDFGINDKAEQNLNLLAKRVGFREKAPAVLVREGGVPHLAVPADLELSQLEYQLSPDVIALKPRAGSRVLALDTLTSETERIGLAFLGFHLRSPLRHDKDLWSLGTSTFLSKIPWNQNDARSEVDVYGGFGFRIRRLDKRLFLSVALTHKYAERAWLTDRYNRDEIYDLKMRHFLYHGAQNWFPVQFLGFTGKTVAEQRFVLEETGQATSVFEYTRKKAGSMISPRVLRLPEKSPAISYQYPGNEKKHYGAAALCKLLLVTEDPATKKYHRLSIEPPDRRFPTTEQIVKEHFTGVNFLGIPLHVSPKPLREPPKVFAVPSMEFGQGKLLRVSSAKNAGGVTLEELGKARIARLLDCEGGVAVRGSLGDQCLLIPQTLHRKVATDFKIRLEDAVQKFLQSPYALRVVVYDDKGAKTLKAQVDAIVRELERPGAPRGHGVLVLPEQAKHDLHNYIKRRLHKHIQLQCVQAAKLQDFYQPVLQRGQADYVVPDRLERNYDSYLRHVVMGVLIVNRQWPWVLEQGTHYDTYIGLDVLNNTAAFSFFYEGGRRCFVRAYESKQQEKVRRAKVAAVIYDNLKCDLEDSSLQSRSIILHRDGRSYEEEWLGFQDATKRLINEGVLPENTTTGIVEVHKNFAQGLRLVSDGGRGLQNPKIGGWRDLGKWEGIVCTTGYPFKFDGTAKPLFVKIAKGDLNIEKVLEDIFAMSQLCWSAPSRCMRLPINLHLCDELLRSTAAKANDDAAIYGEDIESDEELAL